MDNSVSDDGSIEITDQVDEDGDTNLAEIIALPDQNISGHIY